MMKPILLLFALLIAIPTFPQQETLTVDACRTDAKKFFAEMRAPAAANASYFVWAARADEMSRCQDIDPAKPTVESVHQSAAYMGLENAARVAMIEELNNFIHRHGLQKLFIDDDAAGLR